MNIWVTYGVNCGDYGPEYSSPRGFYSAKELAEESIKGHRQFNYGKRQDGLIVEEETIEGSIKTYAVFIELLDDSCEAIPELMGLYSLPQDAHQAAREYEMNNDWAQCRVEEWEVQ